MGFEQPRFNPHNPEFKKVEDLPEERQKDFSNVDDGFVYKSAVELAKTSDDAQEYIAKQADEILKDPDRYRPKFGELSLRSFPREQWSNREIVMKCVTGFENATMDLRSDPHVVMQVIKNNSKEEQLFDKEKQTYIKEFVQKYGNVGALEFASEEIRSDKNFVSEAIKYGAYNFQFASEQLRGDKELALKVLSKIKGGGAMLEFVSDELKNDKEVVMTAVKTSGGSLQYASENLRDDEEIVREAMKRWIYSFQFASERLRSDKNFVLEAIKNSDGKIFEYVSENLKNDEKFIVSAIKTAKYSNYVFNNIPEKMHTKEVLLEFLFSLVEGETDDGDDDAGKLRRSFRKKYIKLFK